MAKDFKARGWSLGAMPIKAETPEEACELYKKEAKEDGHWAIEVWAEGELIWVEPDKPRPSD